jgi:hypothetical protein
MNEPLGYLRKAEEGLRKQFEFFYQIQPEYAEGINTFFAEAKDAVKFVLPENGRIFETKFKALPSYLKLPYEKIVIEYFVSAEGGMSEELYGKNSITPAPKRIVFAQQLDEFIFVMAAVAYKKSGDDQWQLMPYTGRVYSDIEGGKQKWAGLPPEGLDNEMIEGVCVSYSPLGGIAQKMFGKEWENHAYTDMADEVSAILSLVEALACKNVGVEKLPTRKMNKSALKRGALPFDDYHVLTVTSDSGSSGHELKGGARSPREHLRRGHIRRLNSGNIWVNSTVVNAGSRGKIKKIYELEPA